MDYEYLYFNPFPMSVEAAFVRLGDFPSPTVDYDDHPTSLYSLLRPPHRTAPHHTPPSLPMDHLLCVPYIASLSCSYLCVSLLPYVYTVCVRCL